MAGAAGAGDNNTSRTQRDQSKNLVAPNGSKNNAPPPPPAPAKPEPQVAGKRLLPELRTTILLSSETHTGLVELLEELSIKKGKNVKKQPIMELALRNYLRANGIALDQENDPTP
jgi:hypothetical protein